MARPKVPIDENKVEMLARAGCSDHCIAHTLQVGEMTIRRRFGTRLKDWRETAISDAKRELFNRAFSRNDKASMTALIFWLKNYGGMRDQVGVSNPEGGPVETKAVTVDL